MQNNEWTIGADERKFTTKEVALRFDDYLKDSNNLNRLIPVKLKVIKTPVSPFDSKDSIYETKRYLVFRPVFLWNGNFEGTFSNEPGKIRKIKIDGNNTIKWWVPPGTYATSQWVEIIGIAYYGFPQADTLKVVLDEISPDSEALPSFTSYKQWNWKLSNGQKNLWKGIQLVTNGLMSFHAISEFSKDGKHTIFITYTYRKEYKGNEETFTFSGFKIP